MGRRKEVLKTSTLARTLRQKVRIDSQLRTARSDRTAFLGLLANPTRRDERRELPTLAIFLKEFWRRRPAFDVAQAAVSRVERRI
jgi:hypothetical protein